jgi:hypothetical protein
MGFHGLLRPGEVFVAQRRDLTFADEVDSDGMIPACAVLSIQNPKTRRRGARRQHVLLSDPMLLALMRFVWRDLSPDVRLVPYSPATARLRLAQVLARLDVPCGLYTWASLRAGGASFEYLMGTPISSIKFRGRWGAEKSLEHYIQECLTFLDLGQLSAAARHRVAQTASLLPQLL